MENEFGQKFRFILIMASANSIEIMRCRRIVFFIRRLNTAFSHARIGITKAQFRRHKDPCPVAGGFNSGSGTSPAAADD